MDEEAIGTGPFIDRRTKKDVETSSRTDSQTRASAERVKILDVGLPSPIQEMGLKNKFTK
jgi:hypothetical protein